MQFTFYFSHFMFHACITVLSLRLSTNSLNAFKFLTTTTSFALPTLAPVSLFSNISKIMTSSYSVEPRGKFYTENYKLFLKNEFGQPISPFHDIPLVASEDNETYNMVVEVPRWTNAKLEISKSEPLNPIVQDVKKGKMRFVSNVFPHKGYIWNYGAFPQTWEDPKVVHPGTEASGDNDPLDVCDISSIIVPSGSVIQVKVLGILAMIDEGETDWKVIAINTADPLSVLLNDVTDVEKFKPGLLHATLEWFKYYKVPDGKPTNAFGYKNKFRNKEFALEIINETHGFWKNLIGIGSEEKLSEEDCGGIQRMSISVNESPYLITSEQAQEYVSGSAEYDSEAAPVTDPKASEFFFINAPTVTFQEVVTEVAAPAEEPVVVEENGGDVVAVENGAANDESSEVSAAEPSEEPAPVEPEPVEPAPVSTAEETEPSEAVTESVPPEPVTPAAPSEVVPEETKENGDVEVALEPAESSEAPPAVVDGAGDAVISEQAAPAKPVESEEPQAETPAATEVMDTTESGN